MLLSLAAFPFADYNRKNTKKGENSMKRRQRWIALSLTLALLLSGCTWLPADTAPTLSLYMEIYTTDNDALAQVSEALDSYVYQKLGFHVALHTPNNYLQSVDDDLRKGEQVDVALLVSTEQIEQLAQDGLLRPLDELLETSGQGIADSINESYIRDARIDGTLYAFPTNRDRHTSYGFAYNQELADRYNLDLSGVKTPEDLTAVFAQLKSAAPDIYPTVSLSSFILYGMMDAMGDRLGVLMLDDTDRVVNLYETEQFETIIHLLYEWKQADYLLDSSTEQKSYDYYVGSGQVLGCLVQGHEIFASQTSKYGAANVSYIPMTEASYTASNASRLGYAIPTASAYPKQDMALLNLLYTDTYVANLLMYGIEGLHYIRSTDDPETVCYPDTQAPEHYSGMSPWSYCNQYIADRWEAYPAGIWDRVEKANLSAIRSPAVGFSFDSAPVARSYQNCTAIVSAVLPLLLAGIEDPESSLPSFQQALKDAGIDEVITEKQRQLDVYIQKTQ